MPTRRWRAGGPHRARRRSGRGRKPHVGRRQPPRGRGRGGSRARRVEALRLRDFLQQRRPVVWGRARPLLRDHADLLRQRRPPPRDRLLDGQRRRTRPLAPARRRRVLVPHGDRRARFEERPRRRAAGTSTPQEWVDETSRRYVASWAALDIANDDFIRTTEPRHHQSVQRFMQAIYDNGYMHKGLYEGWYCVSCEAYYPEADLLEGLLCPVHERPVEWFTEENWFFDLSRFEKPLLDWYERHPDAIFPDSRRNEALGIINGGLQDISITRTSIDWGVRGPVGPRARLLRLVRRSRQLHHRHRLRRGPRTVREVVAGGPPPTGQGHHPLPLRVVAGDVPRGRHRPTGPLHRPWVATRRRREDVEDALEPDRPRRARGRHRGRRAPLPPRA